MTDTEQRLAQLLQERTEQVQSDLSGPAIRALAAGSSAPSSRRTLVLPLAAAVGVAAAIAVPFIVVHRPTSDPTPVVPGQSATVRPGPTLSGSSRAPMPTPVSSTPQLIPGRPTTAPQSAPVSNGSVNPPGRSIAPMSSGSMTDPTSPAISVPSTPSSTTSP